MTRLETTTELAAGCNATIACVPGIAARQDGFTVETITDDQGFADLKQEWDELLGASASPCLFITWEWLYNWWKHLGADCQLSILTLRCRGELAALAPFVVRGPSLLRRRPFRVLEFLGSGSVGSDYLDFIVRRGCEPEAVRAFASHLAEERLVIDWAQIRRGSSLATGVASRLSQMGWSTAETKTNTCPYIPLAGASWESYLTSLGAEHRYNFTRKFKRLSREYVTTFDRAFSEKTCRESLDIVMTLHNMRWLERGGSDAFHTPGLVAFHRALSLAALQRGWLRLYVLRLNGKPAASLYGFLFNRIFYFYQSGFDPAYRKLSVGLVTMGLAIKDAIEEDADEFDLLHGSEGYKSHWSSKSRELGRLELFPPGGLGWIYRSSGELEQASRAIAKRILPMRVLNGIRAKLHASQVCL